MTIRRIAACCLSIVLLLSGCRFAGEMDRSAGGTSVSYTTTTTTSGGASPAVTGENTTTESVHTAVGSIPPAAGSTAPTKAVTARTSTVGTVPPLTGQEVTPPTSPPTAPSVEAVLPTDTPVASWQPVSPEEYYGRRQLAGDARLLTAYTRIAAGLDDCRGRILLGDLLLTPGQIQKVYGHVVNDYPQLIGMGNPSYTYYVNGGRQAVSELYVQYREGTAADRQAMRQAAADLLADIDAQADEFQREKQLHDRLLRLTAYEEGEGAHDAYGALVEHRAVCEGYARAFQYLLYQAGIPCLIATGNGYNGGDSEPHAWNVVQIDGQWYHVDPTWDDPVVEGGAADLVTYTYFNLTTKEIELDHEIVPDVSEDGSEQLNYDLPPCTTTDAEYFLHEGAYMAALSVDQAAQVLADAVREGSGYAHFRSAVSTATFVGWWNRNAATLLRKAGELLGGSGRLTGFDGYYTGDERRTVTVILRG